MYITEEKRRSAISSAKKKSKCKLCSILERRPSPNTMRLLNSSSFFACSNKVCRMFAAITTRARLFPSYEMHHKRNSSI